MKHKKLIISLTVIVVIIVGGLIGGSLYMIDYSLRPENRGKDLAGSEAYMRETYPQINGWLDSLQGNQLTAKRYIYNCQGWNQTACLLCICITPDQKDSGNCAWLYRQRHKNVPHRIYVQSVVELQHYSS